MAGTVTALVAGQRTVGAAVDAFLAQPRPVTTARTYARTLERLAGQLGRDRPLAGVTDDELAAAASAVGRPGAAHLEPAPGHHRLVPGLVPAARLARREPDPECRPPRCGRG